MAVNIGDLWDHGSLGAVSEGWLKTNPSISIFTYQSLTSLFPSASAGRALALMVEQGKEVEKEMDWRKRVIIVTSSLLVWFYLVIEIPSWF